MGAEHCDENGSCFVGLSIGAKKGCRNVADDQQGRNGRGHGQNDPDKNLERDEAQEGSGDVDHHAVPVQTHPVNQQQGLHPQTLCHEPEHRRNDKHKGKEHRQGSDHVVNVVLKILTRGSANVGRKVTGKLWACNKKQRRIGQ